MTALICRRTALCQLLAGSLGTLLMQRAAAAVDLDRFAAPVDITAEDIAWFRACRAVWAYDESGAPVVVPAAFSLEKFAREEPHEALDRLERTLCAFFVHGRFGSGHYTLEPPVRAEEGFPATPLLADFDVSGDHLRLFRNTNWRQWTIDSKRPYGDYTNYPVEMAEILGIAVPEASDRDGRQVASLPQDTEDRLLGLHHDMLFVLQAYLQQAELAPGRYVIPFDGWDSWIVPRCRPATQAEVNAYVDAVERIRRDPTMTAPARIVPIFGANELLFGNPRAP